MFCESFWVMNRAITITAHHTSGLAAEPDARKDGEAGSRASLGQATHQAGIFDVAADLCSHHLLQILDDIWNRLDAVSNCSRYELGVGGCRIPEHCSIYTVQALCVRTCSLLLDWLQQLGRAYRNCSVCRRSEDSFQNLYRQDVRLNLTG